MRIVHHSIPMQLAASRTGAIQAGRVYGIHSGMPGAPRAAFRGGDAHA